QRVAVPLLQDVPPAAPAPLPPSTPPPAAEIPPPPARVPAWAWVTGAAGLARRATSAALVVDERRVPAAIEQHRGPTACATQVGFQVRDANAPLWRSYGLFVGLGAGGLVSLGASVYGIQAAVRARPPQGARARIRIHPDAWVAPGAAWAGVRA